MLIWNSDIDYAGISVKIVLLIVYLSESFYDLFEVLRVSLMTKCRKSVVRKLFWPTGYLFKKYIRWATLQCWHLMNN